MAALLIREDSLWIGASCVLPLLFKQNIGLAFVAAALLLLALQRRWRSVAGVIGGAAVALTAIAIAFGVTNYARWTMEYAAARRLPPLSDQLAMYNDMDLWWWLALLLAGVFVPRARWLIALPFLWIEFRFLFGDDPSETEINLLRLWPLLVILAAIVFRYARSSIVPVAVVSVVLLHLGSWYVMINRRLAYAKWDQGVAHRSSLPALRGLTPSRPVARNSRS